MTTPLASQRIPNPNCPWVRAQDGANVKVTSVEYAPAELAQNRNACYVFALRNGRLAWGVPFDFLYPGAVNHFATNPEVVTDMQGSKVDLKTNSGGVMSFVCGDARVDGIGLPENRHCQYFITFDLGGNAPAPTPSPTPQAAQLNAEQLDPQTVVLHLVNA